MPDTRRIVYWDANVFLSYVNEIPDRVPTLNALLDDSAAPGGAVKRHTSVLSQVEVAFAASEQKQRLLDPEMERLIDSMWTDPAAVVLVEYHSAIGHLARDLIRTAIGKGWGLKPFDAIHLATAQWLSNPGLTVEEFHTYDKRLVKFGPVVGFGTMEPVTLEPGCL